MSVELLKLTSASLPSADKRVPRICKSAVSTLPTKNLDDSIFSPLPMNKPVEGTSEHYQVDPISQEPPFQQLTTNNPSLSPITVMASDKLALFGTPTSLSSPSSNDHDDVSTTQSTVQSIPSSNTSTPNSIRVKILSSKLKEIPSPHSQITGDKCNSPGGVTLQTPPRALGVSKRHGGLRLKPDSRTKPVKKSLSQGVMRTGPASTLASADESSPDDSIVVVHFSDTEHTSVKEKLYQKMGTKFHKPSVVVYPSMLQHKVKEDRTFLTKETKGVQTENVSVKFDEGTQCEEEKVIAHARGVQTSPGTSTEFWNPVKNQFLFQNQCSLQSLPLPTTTATLATLIHTTTPQLSSSDTVTLIASTAAAAAVAASASLHGNNKNSKDACVDTRNGSVGSQKRLTTSTTRTSTGVCKESGTTNRPVTVKSSSGSDNDNSLIDKKTRIIFDHGSDRKDSYQHRSDLLKQKYEKSSIGSVVEVLHSTAVVREEIEHQCAALECTSTLTDFTEAMIEGRPIQERMRIHQSVNKLIEQAKDEDIQWTPGSNPSGSRSLEANRGKNQLTRQSANQRSTKLGKRKTNHHTEKDNQRHVYGSRLNFMAEADKIAPKTDCGIVMNTLCHDSRWQMNFSTHGVAAVPLGPPRQSKSHPTTLASATTNIFKSVGCQAPSNAITPVKAAELSLKKPDTSACSIKILPPVNISSSSGATEATVLPLEKPSPTASAEHAGDSRCDNFQQVLDICSNSTTNNSDVSFAAKKEGEGVIIEGNETKSTADYQGPSFPPKPVERFSAYNREHLTMSADELDRRLKENLEQKAMEWIHQELLVRLVADRKHDPVGHTVNSCSTCSLSSTGEDLPGVQRISSDKENECVRLLVYEEVLGLIKKALKEKPCEKEKSTKEPEASEMNDTSSSVSALCHLVTPSVTPPSTPTNVQSTTSSSDHVDLVTTPLPTPPQSPTPSVQRLVENSTVSESNRISTPKSSLSSSSGDSLEHNVQTEIVVSSNLSSPSTPQQTITTSVHTPQPSNQSIKEPPTEKAVSNHTIDPATSSTESCSTAGSSPAVSEVTSSNTTTTTTDHEISMGEYILAQPTVVQRAKKPDYSLSEGEVPLSPGDARWNALHAGRLKGNLKEKKKKDITRPNHPVVETFLNLKQALACEKDSDSATEFSADSLQFKPQQSSLSNGEIRGRSHDPFKKLLDKLNSSNSSSDSTGAHDEDKDNTLSEVTSLATQEDITSVNSTPSPAANAVAITATKVTSPGELARNISVLAAPPEDELSLGEVNRSQVADKMSRSPGEVPPILRASETRNGIDVIRISKWSDKLPGDNNDQASAMTSESQYLMEQFDSSEKMQAHSPSSLNTRSQSGNTSQSIPITDHTNTNDGTTESQVYSSSPTGPRVVEGELNRKVVTINIPGTTTGFHSEDTSDSRQHSTEMSHTISEITSSVSSENF